MSIKNNPCYQSFVDPELSAQLWNLGLCAKTHFMWRTPGKGEVELYTNLFDVDGYYAQGVANLKYIKGPEYAFSAFQLGDMEKLLPDYTIDRVINKYTLCMENMWGIAPAESDRLPDVFAKMVLQLLEKNKIFIPRAMEMLQA